jgi:hypothetical protein
MSGDGEQRDSHDDEGKGAEFLSRDQAGGRVRATARMVERALREGWEIPTGAFKLLPHDTVRMLAERKDPDDPKSMPKRNIRDYARLGSMLLKMNEQNLRIGEEGAQAGEGVHDLLMEVEEIRRTRVIDSAAVDEFLARLPPPPDGDGKNDSNTGDGDAD